MTRPRLCRRLRFQPKVRYFKPWGVPLRQLEEIYLTREELEALKLKDFDCLDQVEAAERMRTSQSTFQRILTSARRKMTMAVVLGKALKIEE